jgi:hypothetical protein
MSSTRNSLKKQKSELISATRISNYIKNDTVIDYLDLLDEKNLILSSDLIVSRKRLRSHDNNNEKNTNTNTNINLKKNKTSSFDYIVENGYMFEFDIINFIINEMEKNNEIRKLIKIDEPNIHLNCNQTIQTIIKNKHSIILNSVLINKSNNTWGKPDLIVKGCWINKYIQENIIGINVNKWYIIDIKSSTINLINGGEDVSSKMLYSVYKSQIYIYTKALNELMSEYGINNDVEYGFILGKKYKYISNKNNIIKNSFDCLGVINFSKGHIKGMNWDEIIINAVDWINDLRTNWKDFTLNPINKDELYPNMKNNYDKNWYKVKKQIAIINKEITLLWYCGIANRDLAWKHNIKEYDDPKLNSLILGFNESSSKNKIINSMLKLLPSDKKYILDKKNNFMEWQKKSEWEFFVDFETYNCDMNFDENNEWENIHTTNQKIYMCGISWFNNKNNKFNHKSFIINYKNDNMLKNEFMIKSNSSVKYNDCIYCSNELDLIYKIKNFISSFKPKKMNTKEFFNKTRLMHWSCAEPIIFNKKINEYNLNKSEYDLNWYDLLKVFKYPDHPIIIKECFGFGLKEIIKKLNDHNEINLTWSDLDDGLLSSFIAKDIYDNINITNPNSNMFDIIEYNYIDCKALFELLQWMRKSVKN